jgi:adenylate cyclase
VNNFETGSRLLHMTADLDSGTTTLPTHQVILFADIAGSTALYEQIGDAEARRVTAAALARMRAIADGHQGRTAAELGDELMCFFARAEDAATAACEMHASIGEEFCVPPDGRRLQLRIGMHFGVVYGDKDDLMSETAKIAHWAASNAKPDQTLATAPVIERLPRLLRAVSRYVDDETWNFVSFEHVALYEIIWDLEAITAAVVEQAAASARRYESIEFTRGDEILVVNPERPVVSVGRGTLNDLVVQHDLVSRQHFTAQFSRGRCTISDRSTNGTYVIADRSPPQVVRHETVPLSGSGRIVLGRADDPTSAATIRYRCR